MDTTRRNLMIGTLAAPMLAGAAEARAPVQTPAPEAGNASLTWPTPSATIDLWPNGVSGALHPDMRENVEETTTDPAIHFRRVQGITRPRLAVFPAEKPNGGAMLIIPGGGFYWNYFDHEGYQLADFLNRQGLTCFVLFYRLAGDGWDRPADVALIDAQRAMRVIRANAAPYGLDAERVGVAGFSAGGFLTATLATRHGAQFQPPVDAVDALSARPMLAAPIYPVQSVDPACAYDGVAPTLFGGKVTPEIIKAYSPDRNVDADTSPVFLVHAEDDDVVPVANSVNFRNALHAGGIPVESHLFASGGHGFGMKNEPDQPWHLWPQLLAGFARSRGLMG